MYSLSAIDKAIELSCGSSSFSSLIMLRIMMIVVVVDPYEYLVDLCKESCSAGQLSCMAKTLAWDITHKLFNQICSYLPCL